MPDVPQINPCLDCKPESSVLSTIASVAIQSDGVAPASQARVAVAGNNVAVLPSATYQSVFIKNTGPAVVWIRLASGAATGANGEIPLAAEITPGAGNGGSISISTFVGTITASCASTSSVSVTWSV